MQQVPALDIQRLAPQLGEARRTEHVRRDAVFLLEHLGGLDHFAQDRARPEQVDAHLALAALPEAIQALEDALARAFGHRRLRVVLVHAGDVIEHGLLLARTCGAGRPARSRRARTRTSGRRRCSSGSSSRRAGCGRPGAAGPRRRASCGPRCRRSGSRACACRRQPRRSRRRAGTRTSSSRCRTAPCRRRGSRTTCPRRSSCTSRRLR